jgi:ribonuclease P protein subunit POP4
VKRVVPRLQGPPRDVARGELIGLRVRIAASSDPSLVSREGLVVDESLRTLTVRWEDGRESRLGKPGTTFAFLVRQAWVEVPGDAIEFRPEDRTKKVR